MKNKDYYAVIMAGGIGSRFWPVSTQDLPKQFHDMLGTGKSLLQQTFSRLSTFIPPGNIFILTNERYKSLTLEQLPILQEHQIVLEPAMKNTAPCILLAALKIKKINKNALMLVAPSDHWIEDEKAFKEDVQLCFEAAQGDDILMTLGITPTFPNTGYGYIDASTSSANALLDDSIKGIDRVQQFTEKPDYETAKKFLEAGNFLWNAGIFIWSVESICKAFKSYLPKMNALFSEGVPVLNTLNEWGFVDENYPLAENISIDYGIMEKAKNVFVKKANFDWNDLGTWGALHDKMTSDTSENAVVTAKTYLKNAKGNMIFSATDKLIVVDGLNDYIIVDKEDVLLLFPRKKEQEIKRLLSEVSNKFGTKYS
ncbi:mannose-1-phosphate guanylyltransferase [Patiriisocius sp. Uisw_017]|uniref:mannose-1-phosphate guanylyltransferase n=1 Tax=Patiriisocius sp. Uisw_017 TaxID=3230968 RepID=UPI0039E8DD13